ncbi:hypothetical protein [Rhodoplanes sp. Z2-YC6860]|uniref:hypothetical protein n=1 Tax=Rhodoplanes sp. Z2-YC6860 TaxID=674703 RepID=UPI00078D765E|nr:hypothetical protein [Rhodoplanes sp. Z2-YC6860]AMN44068.1 hypothetical protein RHPLAN_56520 [Rhodoplanes sp. Z2-YC6860]
MLDRVGFRVIRAIATTVAAAIVIVAASVVWRSVESPTYVHRFRLTIEAVVDGEVHRGSGVIEVRTTDYDVKMPGAKGISTRVLGDAVFVNLGKGRNVLAALGTGPHASVEGIAELTRSAFMPIHPGLTYRDVPNLAGAAPLTEQQVPTLVGFTDLNDPKTARVIAPGEFEKVFGKDVHFKRAFVEMVPAGTWPFNMIRGPAVLAGEPVTRGLEQKLHWLPHPQYLDGQSVCDHGRHLDCLHGGHFTRG